MLNALTGSPRVPAAAARSSRSATGRPCERVPHSLGTAAAAGVGYVASMPLRLSEHREQDRPRERFWAVGPAALTGQELLAIVLGTGCAGRDALAVAGDLLAKCGGSLRRVGRRPAAALARGAGVGRAQGARPGGGPRLWR